MKLYLALWVSKFYLFIKKLTKKDKSDRAGLLAARICPEILTKIAKPKLVIAITGTNGKSTISYLLYDFLKKEGKRIGFNDWGANMRAGHIRCLLDSVNIFNKPNKDVAILEVDELTSNTTLPEIKPDYVIVTNLARDSIRRNSYPEIIFNKLNEAFKPLKNTKLILNADDPISSFLGEYNEKKFVSVNKIEGEKPYENISPDFIVCPKCNTIVEYEYKHYRHFGRIKCPGCGLESFKGDFVVTSVSDDKMVMNDIEYKNLSPNLFNVYNEAMAIIALKMMDYPDEKIKDFIDNATVHKSRENMEEIKGIKVYMQMAKAQNGSAVSSVLENLAKLDSKKELLLILDEEFVDPNSQETITWIYDTDFELLNDLNLEKIVIVGDRCLDYVARIKLAGVSADKIVATKDYNEGPKLIDFENKSDIYVLYDVDRRPQGAAAAEQIKNRIRNEVQ